MLEERIELSDPQFDFLTSDAKHTGFVAGFGSGKSYIGTLKSLMKIIDNGVPKTAYYLPTYGDIRDIAFDGFPLVAEQLGYKYKLNKTDKEFYLLDRYKKEVGKTMFRNMSEPESIVGYQVGYSLIDETDILKQEIMDKAFKKILGRNRLILPVEDESIINIYNKTNIIPNGAYFHKELKKLCWINGIDVAGTPEGFKWFYKRFVKQFRITTDKLIRASTYSNLHNLPDDFIETLRAEYPSELFDAYVNGEFVNLTSGTVFKYFKRDLHLTDRIEDNVESLHIGQDFNIGSCISIVHIRDGADLIAVNEVVSYDTKDIITNLKELYPNRSITIYPDASGDSRKTSASKTDIQMLRDAGFKVCVDSRNPSIKDRVNIQNNLFDKNRYFINEKRCPRLIEAFEQHSYDEKTQAPQKFNSHPAIDDFTDSATYCSAYLFPMVKNGVKQTNLSYA